MATEHSQSHTPSQNATNQTSSETNNENNIRWEGNPNIWMRRQDDKWFATIGIHRITQQYDTIDELETELYAPTAGTVVSITSALIESFATYEKYKQK